MFKCLNRQLGWVALPQIAYESADVITGDEIRDGRNRAGLSQQELANLVGVSLRTVGNWERGATVPRDREPALQSVLGGQPASESPLSRVSDMDLLAEVARRLARAEREVGDGNDRSAAPMKMDLVWSGRTSTDAPASEAQEPAMPVAARDIGRKSSGQQHRDRLDQLGEDNQDTGDTDPA